ncbi:acetoin utilization protein AcuC [Gracilibacillus ureilyticus]|uniref:Acetoin utilization protein AcuC n=1 Tax=Gracilibacillus ureilyticus TaxID=531814 RepID=A0A1H9TD61_9BACI|nr:acetoin utilization protein AcuC [Gracilibacillus ureilyticus]SER94874.1 acetoin utilization protein AcuC [Gracilibacillus ureilyticus]
MSLCKTAFVYSDKFLNYSFHHNHPFNQKRILLTKDLLEAHGALSPTSIEAPESISDSILELIHTPEYVEIVKKASEKHPTGNYEKYGIGTADTPGFEGMYKASKSLVEGSVKACELVANNKVTHALNLGGGLHHGFPNHAAGFCIFNDIAIAIKFLRKNYNWKVLYIDTDAHHGDGVQHCFYDDPEVCTVSFHETGRYLYPGTGKINERGIKKGFGYSFNFPFDAFTEDDSFLKTFHNAIDEICEFFQPDIIVSQHGADSHFLDPLTHMHCSIKIFEEIPKKIHQLAHQYCYGKWVALGGGGYDIWRVVPRAWAQLWHIMNNNEPFSGEINSLWHRNWQPEAPLMLPQFWEDPINTYHPIPRRSEITNTNKEMLEQVLRFTKIAKKSAES